MVIVAYIKLSGNIFMDSAITVDSIVLKKTTSGSQKLKGAAGSLM